MEGSDQLGLADSDPKGPTRRSRLPVGPAWATRDIEQEDLGRQCIQQ
jgi:hypothetical protein